MVDFGFTNASTPNNSVQEFYRKQGDLRTIKKLLEIIKDIEAPMESGRIVVFVADLESELKAAGLL